MIECTNFKKIEKGSLLGYADFYIPKMGLEIFGCSVFIKNEHRFVNLPSKEITDNQGVKKYYPILRFKESKHQQEFSRQAIQAIDKKYSSDIMKEEKSVSDEVSWELNNIIAF